MLADIDPLVPAKPGKLNLIVVHQGTHPLHHLSLLFYDPEKAMNIGLMAMSHGSNASIQQKTLAEATRNKTFELLLPEHFEEISFDYTPLKMTSHRYEFSFEGLNGTWNEILLLQLVKGSWLEAYRISKVKQDSKKLLTENVQVVEHVDPGFPKPFSWAGERLHPLGLAGTN